MPSPNHQRLLTATTPQLKRLSPGWLSSVAVGLTTGAISIIFALSYAVLIFSGGLAAQLPIGIGLVLFSIATTRIAIALTSSYAGMVADLSTVPTAILAWSVGMTAKSLPAGTPTTEVTITVLVMIALTSILTGAVFLLLSHMDLTKVARWLPPAVLGGFIASTGWLLVKGAVKVMTDKPLELNHLAILTNPSVLLHGLPGVLLAIHLLIVTKRCQHPLAMSSSLLGAIAVFYLVLSMLGSSVAQASANNWMLPMPTQQTTQSMWQWFKGDTLTSVHWQAIASQWMCLATVTVTATLSLLLNVNGLELVTQRPINANREFKVAGIANLFLGLVGGVLSFQSLSKSVLAHKMGNSQRMTTLIDAGVVAIAPLLGTSLLAYFPKVVLGGLLMFLGLSLLVEWAYVAWFRLSKRDYFIVQLIWITSGTIGFLQGLTLGWLLAMALLLFQPKTMATER